ncbi:MAG: hypothetical protein ABI193_20190 [Minicystis sp.]
MSSKKKKSADATATAKAPHPLEVAAAENEGMPARVSAAPAVAPSALEGEGSRTAAHHYEEGLKASIASGKTEALAEEARKALEGPEAADLKKAESAARQGHTDKHHP